MNELTDHQAELLLRNKDETSLFYIAMTDERPNMHEQALLRLKDPAHLKAAALRETDCDLQYSLLMIIDDAEVNAFYAKSAAFPEIREIAAARLEDQNLLYEIFTEANRHQDENTYAWDDLAHTAFEKIHNESIRAKIALDPSLPLYFREIAVRQLKDQTILEELLTDQEETLAKTALSKITDEKILVETACCHQAENVRLAAFGKLSNESLLRIIEDAPDELTRTRAVKHCKAMSQTLATRLLKSNFDILTRIGALNFVKKRELILSIACNEQDNALSYHAYQRLKADLTKEEAWMLLKTAVSREVRFSLIRFCEDIDMLHFAAEHDTDTWIRKRAADRLTYTFFD